MQDSKTDCEFNLCIYFATLTLYMILKYTLKHFLQVYSWKIIVRKYRLKISIEHFFYCDKI